MTQLEELLKGSPRQRKIRPTPMYERQRPSKPQEPARMTGPTSVSITIPTLPLVRQVACEKSLNASPLSSHPPANTGPPKKSGSRPTCRK